MEKLTRDKQVLLIIVIIIGLFIDFKCFRTRCSKSSGPWSVSLLSSHIKWVISSSEAFLGSWGGNFPQGKLHRAIDKMSMTRFPQHYRRIIMTFSVHRCLPKIHACKNNTCWQKTCWHAGHQRRFIGHRRWLAEIISQKSMDFQDIPPLCSSYCSFFPWWSRWDPLRIIIWFLLPTDIFTEIIIFWISLSISTKLSGSVLPVQLPHWLHHVLREDTKGPGNHHHHHLLKWPRHHWSSSPFTTLIMITKPSSPMMTFVQQGDRLVGSAISLLWMVVHSVQVRKSIFYAVDNPNSYKNHIILVCRELASRTSSKFCGKNRSQILQTEKKQQ